MHLKISQHKVKQIPYEFISSKEGVIDQQIKAVINYVELLAGMGIIPVNGIFYLFCKLPLLHNNWA